MTEDKKMHSLNDLQPEQFGLKHKSQRKRRTNYGREDVKAIWTFNVIDGRPYIGGIQLSHNSKMESPMGGYYLQWKEYHDCRRVVVHNSDGTLVEREAIDRVTGKKRMFTATRTVVKDGEYQFRLVYNAHDKGMFLRQRHKIPISHEVDPCRIVLRNKGINPGSEEAEKRGRSLIKRVKSGADVEVKISPIQSAYDLPVGCKCLAYASDGTEFVPTFVSDSDGNAPIVGKVKNATFVIHYTTGMRHKDNDKKKELVPTRRIESVTLPLKGRVDATMFEQVVDQVMDPKKSPAPLTPDRKIEPPAEEELEPSVAATHQEAALIQG